MDPRSRKFRRFLSAGLSVASFAFVTLPSAAQQILVHPGRVLEMPVARPLAIEIKAWSDADKPGNDGGCPTYGKVLDRTASNPASGQFELKVEKTSRTFTVTYCAQGYYPRADQALRNGVNGSFVIPHPVAIYPRTLDPKVYDAMVMDKTTALLNDLAYLQSIHPERFNNVLKNLAEDSGTNRDARQKVLMNVREAVTEWRR